jgi:hypothetical protein
MRVRALVATLVLAAIGPASAHATTVSHVDDDREGERVFVTDRDGVADDLVITTLEDSVDTRHADRLTGDDGPNRLYGGPGVDRLVGAGTTGST